MRVCQPGPVARQRFTTSGGKRREMSWRGLGERGRPPLLTTARRSISSVSSGSPLYSERRIRCASARARSEPKVRREAGLLTFVCFSHAENVAIRAARGVADDHQSALEPAVADHPDFAIFLAGIFQVDRRSGEHDRRILMIKAPFPQCACTLGQGTMNFDSESQVTTASAKPALPALAEFQSPENLLEARMATY